MAASSGGVDSVLSISTCSGSKSHKLTSRGYCGRNTLPTLYVELKPRLSVVQFVLYGCFKSFCVVRVEESTLSVRMVPVGREQYKFRDFVVNPLSANGLAVVSSQEMHWRMTLTSLFDAEVKDSQVEETSFTVKGKGSEVQDLCERGGITVSCRNCGKKLFVRDRPFSRVLPLPSDGWREVAENWFCHKQKDDVPDVLDIERLQPREDEVWIGETDFYMAITTNTSHCFKFREGSADVQCDRCTNVIGSAHNTQEIIYTEIDLHSVIVSSSTSDKEEVSVSSLATSEYCDILFSRLLLNQAHIYTSFKFIVESKVNGKFQPFILVWLMDQHAYIGSPKTEMSSRDVVFTPVVKLLYQGCVGRRNKETADLWSRDMAVHSIELPSVFCLKVLSSLIEATREMPPSLRFLNGFHVGYLRR